MKIIGIIGQICAGKTTVCKALVANHELQKYFSNGIVYIEGDAKISKLYKENNYIIEKIRSVYPESVVNNIVDTKILGKFFFKNKENQNLIESIVHPELKKSILNFININAKENMLVILDVPVLFKLQLNEICNYIAFFTANEDERVDRGIKRISNKHQMTHEEAKQRFVEIDNIAIKQNETTSNIVIDTTNYKNNPDFTINVAISKIFTFIKKI